MEREEFTLLRVLDDRIVIERVPDCEKVGDIWVPDQAKQAQTEGYVVALGDNLKTSEGTPLSDCPVRVGDRVLFSRYAGVEFLYGDSREPKVMVILRLADIHGIFQQPVGTDPVFTERAPVWKD